MKSKFMRDKSYFTMPHEDERVSSNASVLKRLEGSRKGGKKWAQFLLRSELCDPKQQDTELILQMNAPTRMFVEI